MSLTLGVVAGFLCGGRANFGSFSKTLRAHISESTLPNTLLFGKSSFLTVEIKCVNFYQNLEGYRFKFHFFWVI